MSEGGFGLNVNEILQIKALLTVQFPSEANGGTRVTGFLGVKLRLASNCPGLNKIFQTGSKWKQEERLNINMIDEGAQTCALRLLIKDHKGWLPDTGTCPPSRPVVAGNSGLNMHLSEIISKILEPIAENGKAFEVNSTGHMLDKIDKLNKYLKDGVYSIITH